MQNLRKQIEDQRGSGIVYPGNTIYPAPVIPTGAFVLDYALGGGIPDGRGTMVYGPEGCGKSTLLYLTLAQAQIKYPGSHVLLCDPEQNFDEVWARSCGLDTSRVEYHAPSSCEEAVDVVSAYSYVKDISMVGLDSVAALFTQAEVADSSEDKHVAERARLMGVLYSKILGSWAKEKRRGHRVTYMIVNQFREKVGLMFGDPRTLPGGRAINYYFPRLKIEMLKQGKVYVKSDRTGLEIPDHNVARFKLAKEKGSTLKEGEFKLNLNPENDNGVPVGRTDDYDTVVAYAKKWGIITGGGKSWRVEDRDQKFPNLAGIRSMLIEEPEEFTRLRHMCIIAQREGVGLPPLPIDGYLYDWVELEGAA